jgi:para-aminobenzoate synthetase
VKTLLIDNHDSFTFNLYQRLAEVNGELPVVIRNDADPALVRQRGFDNVVISPGPGRPERGHDFGICARVIAEAEVPLLGVCLGHQGVGHVFGARVVLAPEPVHGRTSRIRHDGSALFSDIPQGAQVVRYHSFMLAPELPAHLEAIAWTDDGVIMAIRHRERPLWGVQFHPESIGTEHGTLLLQNFRDLTRAHQAQHGRARPAPPAGPRRVQQAGPPRVRPAAPASPAYELHTERLDVSPDPERVFVHFFGGEASAFWLDSSLESADARFHFMGDASGPLSEVVRYDVRRRELSITTEGSWETRSESVFAYLSRALAERAIAPDPGLPFDFACGFVGYFGYELKAECGGADAHVADTPDACFLFADRVLVFDVLERVLYLLCLTRPGDAASARRWFDRTRSRLDALPPLPPIRRLPPTSELTFRLARDRARYIDDIASCLREIRQGESYEICLTNRLLAEADLPPLDYHRVLRRSNPAPYAAFLRFGDLCVACSSPERFLRIDRSLGGGLGRGLAGGLAGGLGRDLGRERWVESRPIKGTLPRGATPAEDAALREALRASDKNRSENLMIIDLVRNDLGRVCEVGTVQVPTYMEVESYATVHQLVSTIRGRLRADMTVVDCVRAAFPGGSMTGAPKIRTMQIIDALEPGARGVYSGSIGWLSLSGTADLNIVIRTAVFQPGRVSIGVGGAIVALSDIETEFDEIVLKARALVQAATAMLDTPPCST